ncbi:DNA repair protein rad51d [Dissophora ornata]|nr:DNA repair protein rad51d [Dissophora ornata]
MLDTTPSPTPASDLYLERSSRGRSSHLATGWKRIDQLIGGGWVPGEVSEICGSSGAGKTQMCLNAMASMLVRDKTSRAIWIDTLDGGFSAQRSSDIIRAHMHLEEESPTEASACSRNNDRSEQVKGALSRIQVYGCRDVYDVINVIEAIRADFEQADQTSEPAARLIVIDSLTTVLTGLLRGTDGVGHATMMHTARELRRLALDFDVTLMVTTLSVQMSYPEEQSPSILMTSNSKPSLGSSWRYATDLQLYLTRLNPAYHRHQQQYQQQQLIGSSTARMTTRLESDLFGDDPDMDESRVPDESGVSNASSRVAEIMKSKRVKIGDWCMFDL